MEVSFFNELVAIAVDFIEQVNGTSPFNQSIDGANRTAITGIISLVELMNASPNSEYGAYLPDPAHQDWYFQVRNTCCHGQK